MTDHSSEHQADPPRAPVPHPRLRDLDVLAGTWQLRGSDLDGGNEFTGYDHAGGVFRSMLFSDEGPGPFCSFALEYYWQIEGDDLTIWHGEQGSPARFTGTIDRAAGVIDGRWEWPGGGYRATSTRIVDPGTA